MKNQKHRSAELDFALSLALGAGCSNSDSNTKVGVVREGGPCNAVQGCLAPLRCVASLFTVNVCGRPCSNEKDCKSGERCYSYSDLPEDGHCVNVVTDEYATCGVSDTSVCGNGRSCLYLPNRASGLCVTTCALDGSATGGAGDEDAGMSTV